MADATTTDKHSNGRMNGDHPIYMVTVSAPTNIAVIKYWGKADAHYNTLCHLLRY